MPRIPRKFIETPYIHIMTQGINKNYIFEYAEDLKYYIKIMYELQKEYSLKIIAYCIMNNHAHILIQVYKIKELSKYMQRLNMKYGIYYNKKYNRVGFVFRNRYKAEGIYSEEHLYNCIKYIYDNPVKAGICKTASEYPYSNYKEIKVQTNNNYSFIEVEEDRKKEITQVIDKFCKENNITKDKLPDDLQKLKKIIILLKDVYKNSFREISRELKVGREKIRNMYE